MVIEHLHVDFETRSELDLTEVGLDRYAKHSSTRVLMLGYAFDNEEAQIWIPSDSPIPAKLLSALKNPKIKKIAWNASFERAIFKHVMKIDIPLEQWIDPSAWARHLSLPGGLDACGEILGLPADQAKMKIGKSLIDHFCYPYTFGGKITLFGVSPVEFHEPSDSPEQWELFQEYCKQDVRAERTILDKMKATPLPEREQKIWVLDQKINERGIPVDKVFAQNNLDIAQSDKHGLLAQMRELTGLVNPNSRAQILPWLSQHGYPFASLNKNFVKAALAKPDLPGLCRQVLNLRMASSKIAYTKLETLSSNLSDDDRLRYQFVFMGASRSGRWSGYGVQPQNLPRPIKFVEKNYDKLREIVVKKDLVALEKLLSAENPAPSPIDVAVSLIRAAFASPKDSILVACDLSAIENRVLGWVTGCAAILEVFEKGLDPYVDFATRMYQIPYDILIKDKEKRQIAKPAVLGCGYGLGSGVERIEVIVDGVSHYEYRPIIVKDKDGNMVKTGLLRYAENMGVMLTPEQAWFAHQTFKNSFVEVTSYKPSEAPAGWYAMERAAIKVLEDGGEAEVGPVVFSRLRRKNGQYVLRIKLPSGRYLHYLNAHVIMQTATSKRTGKEYEKPALYYDGIGHGVGATTSGWGTVYTYGGKLMENVVQAISRDILSEAMLLAEERGGEICLHVHDEIVCLSNTKKGSFRLSDLQECMSTTPAWAIGLPLKAEGYEGVYYKK